MTIRAAIPANIRSRMAAHMFLMRCLLEHEWARGYAERPGVTVVETADDVFVGLQRLASEPTDLIWA